MIHPILKFLKNASTCPPFDMIVNYYEGRLSEDYVPLVSEHLEICQSCSDVKSFLNIDFKINEEHIKDINNKLQKTGNTGNLPIEKPDIAPGQIWTTRSKFLSVLGENIYTFYPYPVLIKTTSHKLKDTHPIIRVQPVSTITEFIATGDIYIKDPDYIGVPFIIETWNEQPMPVENLEKYVCNIEEDTLSKNLIKEEPSYDLDLISDFRYLEIENTAYLRRPVIALLEYYEKLEEEKIKFLGHLWEEIKENKEKKEAIIKSVMLVGISISRRKKRTMGVSDEEKEIFVDILDESFKPSGDKINLKVIDPPHITPRGIFKAKFCSSERKVENRILSLTIKLQEEEKLSFTSVFKALNDDLFEASFTIEGFEGSCLIPEDAIELFLWTGEI